MNTQPEDTKKCFWHTCPRPAQPGKAHCPSCNSALRAVVKDVEDNLIKIVRTQMGLPKRWQPMNRLAQPGGMTPENEMPHPSEFRRMPYGNQWSANGR